MAIPQPLKLLLFRCLGGENERASLSELKNCIKELMRELAQQEKEHGKTQIHCGMEKLEEEEAEMHSSMVVVKES
jgi:hypothetical protein